MDIQTFIFLDLETTGFPWLEDYKTKITEISLIAVLNEHIISGTSLRPRIQNKLSLCFNPNKDISNAASKLTGLTADLLKYQSQFDERTCYAIKGFLELQRQPICFVAHNGNSFDYPILKAEFNNASCLALIDDILCIDSIQIFKDLNTSKKGYKLAAVYETLVKKESENAHTAEGDVYMLMECAATLGQAFVTCAEARAQKLSNITMMMSRE